MGVAYHYYMKERHLIELQDPLRRINYLSSVDFKQSEVVTTALYIFYHLAQCRPCARNLQGIGKQIEIDLWILKMGLTYSIS